MAYFMHKRPSHLINHTKDLICMKSTPAFQIITIWSLSVPSLVKQVKTVPVSTLGWYTSTSNIHINSTTGSANRNQTRTGHTTKEVMRQGNSAIHRTDHGPRIRPAKQNSKATANNNTQSPAKHTSIQAPQHTHQTRTEEGKVQHRTGKAQTSTAQASSQHQMPGKSTTRAKGVINYKSGRAKIRPIEQGTRNIYPIRASTVWGEHGGNQHQNSNNQYSTAPIKYQNSTSQAPEQHQPTGVPEQTYHNKPEITERGE